MQNAQRVPLINIVVDVLDELIDALLFLGCATAKQVGRKCGLRQCSRIQHVTDRLTHLFLLGFTFVQAVSFSSDDLPTTVMESSDIHAGALSRLATRSWFS